MDADDHYPDAVEIRLVHPFEARKRYVCPGCQQEIPVGLAHMVVVPLDDVARRRHWHKACWASRSRRRPGRS